MALRHAFRAGNCCTKWAMVPNKAAHARFLVGQSGISKSGLEKANMGCRQIHFSRQFEGLFKGKKRSPPKDLSKKSLTLTSIIESTSNAMNYASKNLGKFKSQICFFRCKVYHCPCFKGFVYCYFECVCSVLI